MKTKLYIDVVACARCGEDHKSLKFKKLTKPEEGDYTHWSMCPTLDEPILLKIVIYDN
jgi:hypothetical protein